MAKKKTKKATAPEFVVLVCRTSWRDEGRFIYGVLALSRKSAKLLQDQRSCVQALVAEKDGLFAALNDVSVFDWQVEWYNDWPFPDLIEPDENDPDGEVWWRLPAGAAEESPVAPAIDVTALTLHIDKEECWWEVTGKHTDDVVSSARLTLAMPRKYQGKFFEYLLSKAIGELKIA